MNYFFLIFFVIIVFGHVHQEDNHLSIDANNNNNNDANNRNATDRLQQQQNSPNAPTTGLVEIKETYSHTCIHDEVQRNTRQVDVFIDYGTGASASNAKRQVVATN